LIALDKIIGLEHSGKDSHFLVIDEDKAIRSACMDIAARHGFTVDGSPDLDDAKQQLGSCPVNVLLIDLSISRKGLRMLEEIKAISPDTAIIVMTASASIRDAVEAMRMQASDYLLKPFTVQQLEAALEQTVQNTVTSCSENLIGVSQEMDKLYRMLAKVAQSHHPALIVGETGTGKETVARTIHAQSEFSTEPFLTVECGALGPQQIEHTLFGYVEGAFPDALHNHPGVLASAERGTVLLDEIGQLTPDLQATLLKVLQDKEISPAGAAHRIPLHARVLAANSIDLAAAVTKGTFRKDLYHRLNVVTLRIPPLRERRTDIPLLATYFLDRISRESGQTYTLSDDTLRSMINYEWPGNVRELENTIERACTMAEGTKIYLGDLPTFVRDHELELRREAACETHKPEAVMQPPTEPKIAALSELEKEAILSALQQLKGDKLLAAHRLGIGKTTMYRKLKEYGVAKDLEAEVTPRSFVR
jgi:two-component system response regulator HydG